MHSGGAQKSGQRSQPAQSDFLGSQLVVRLPEHSFAAVGAARRGHSRGFQRSSLCLIVLTRALCASLVPRGAKSASALATFFANGCDSEASRSHVLTQASASSFFCSPSRALAAARPRAGRAAARAAPDLVRWGADERAHGHRRAGASAEGRRRRSKISLRRGRGAAPRRCAARRRACEALLGTLGRYARVVCSGSVATETPRARTWKPEHCTVCVAAQLTHGAPPRWRRAPRW